MAVVGVGRMGKYHCQNFAKMTGQAKLIGVLDRNADRCRQVADEFKVRAFGSVAELIAAKPAAVTVAVPTVDHLASAEPFLRAGIPVLVEKPLAPTLAEARELAALVTSTGTMLQVGHSERFNPVATAIQQMNIRPRFIEVHRISPFTFRSADVGAVMDIMIHDIDIVLHLVGSKVVEVRAVGVNVIGEHEDLANARLAFANGCVANLTASRLALKTERKIRVFSDQAYVSMDYQKHIGIAVVKNENTDLLSLFRQKNATDLAELAASGVNYTDLLKVQNLQLSDDQPLARELESFLDSVATGKPPAVSAADGLAAIETANAIVQSIKSHRWDGQPGGLVGLAGEQLIP
ncbi:MAG: Gfo/Idh/MocA family oxidoreductase [Phycisphaerae bacterium]|nr:Gfo/Idh/MocA family oxidoreductase [Phycisphaerae bacterium]